MTDGDHFLYAVSAECPCCREVTQFIEITESPVDLDMDVPLDGKSHCPECGIHLDSVGGEWDVHEEHEVETVKPTQERDSA